MPILIIKCGALGDVMRTTSILPALKNTYQTPITWATKPSALPLLEHNSFIDDLIIVNDASKKKLQSIDFDLVISLDDEEEMCAFATTMKTKKLVGAYLKEGRRTYTANAAPWFDMGLLSTYGKQKADELKAANTHTYQTILHDILQLPYTNQEPILELDQPTLSFAEAFAAKHHLHKDDLVIGINTGAGGRWQEKKLTIADTVTIIKRLLADLQPKIILFGGPEEEERNQAIQQQVTQKIIDAGCKNTLNEFAGLINLCSIILTSDSLALHIGTALKKHLVAFFYPTSSAEIELYGRGVKIIGKGASYCSYQKKCTYPPEWDLEQFITSIKNIAQTL